MRIVQVGLGAFGRGWLPILQAADDVELAGVVDTSAAARMWAETMEGVASDACFATIPEAVTGARFDAALVVTPPETHRAVAEEALAAGKHVLLEKPLATTLEDARALLDAATAANQVLMVSQNYRFRPPARAAQEVIRGGAIGELVAVEVTCRRDTRTLFPPDDFRYRMRHPFVLDMAIHHVDLLRALTGRDVLGVFARSWRVPDSPYAHDPAVVAILELEGGAAVTYTGDWATHGSPTSWNGEWTVVGERGRLTWRGGESDALAGEVTVERWGEAPAVMPLPDLPRVDRAGSLAAFQEAVETGREPETSGRDNIRSLATVLAMVDSIERGTVAQVVEGGPDPRDGVPPSISRSGSR